MPGETIPNTEAKEEISPSHINESKPQEQVYSILTQEDQNNTNRIIDTKQREGEIKKKKRKFKLLMIALFCFILLLIAIPSAVKYYKANFIKNEPVIPEETEEEKRIREEKIEAESRVLYDSAVFKLTLEYLKEAKLTETVGENDQIKKLEIAYDKQDGQELVTTANLREGYIFKVSSFTISQRNLDQIAEVKKESILSGCPSTATATKTEITSIDGVDSRTFEVLNCELDYKFTYAVKEGVNYEFTQVFKGDVGFKQLYKIKTEDILGTIKFYVKDPDDGTENGLTVTYKNDLYKFSFDHPKFVSDCCDMASPVLGKSTQLIVLGDPSNIVDRNNYDGIGIFIDENHRGKDFNTFMEDQKNTLKEDYVVVRGEVPKPEDISIKVGDKDAVMLKGYSWRGDTLVYVDITNAGGRERALIISIKNTSGESFENKVNEILKSFKFSL